MGKCQCCGNNGAFVMKPRCDRCFLGWNGPCCEFYAAINQAIEDASSQTCGELGFYEVPFSLQIKRINKRIRAENMEACA